MNSLLVLRLCSWVELKRCSQGLPTTGHSWLWAALGEELCCYFLQGKEMHTNAWGVGKPISRVRCHSPVLKQERGVYLLAALCLWSTTHTPTPIPCKYHTVTPQLWHFTALNQCCGRESFTHSSPLTPRKVKPGCGCGLRPLMPHFCLHTTQTGHEPFSSFSFSFSSGCQSKTCAGKSQCMRWIVWEGLQPLKSRGGEAGKYRGALGRSFNHIFFLKKVCGALLAGGCGRWRDKWTNPTFSHCWHPRALTRSRGGGLL